MTDHTPPIRLNLHISLWINCEDDKGRHYSQITVENTPRILYDFIPLKERSLIPRARVFYKDTRFKFKGKTYTLQFERTKEAGEP